MSEDLISKAFHALDANKDGFVTLEEIDAVFKAHNIAYDHKRFQEVFVELDKDHDHKLDIKEFEGLKEHKEEFKLFLPALGINK